MTETKVPKELFVPDDATATTPIKRNRALAAYLNGSALDIISVGRANDGTGDGWKVTYRE